MALRHVSSSPAAWSALRTQLEGLDAGELLELLRVLCERSADNRRFLAARLANDEEGGVLEDYRERIEAEFVLTDPPRRPRLGAARKAIRDYRKASADDAGAADLMLACLEAGTNFARQHEDPGDAYFASLAQVLGDLAAHLRAQPHLHAALAPRLRALRRDSKRVGWTWGPQVAEVVDRFEAEG
jgi:hypothetical protein